MALIFVEKRRTLNVESAYVGLVGVTTGPFVSLCLVEYRQTYEWIVYSWVSPVSTTEEHRLQRITPLRQVTLERKGVWTGTQIFLCWTLFSAPCISNECSSLHERACSPHTWFTWGGSDMFSLGFLFPDQANFIPILDLCRCWSGMSRVREGERGRGGRIVYIKSERRQWHWGSFAATQILLHSRFQAPITIVLLKLWVLDFLGRLKTDTISAVLYVSQCPVLQGKSIVWGVLTCEIIPMKPAELQGSSGLPRSHVCLCLDKIEVFYLFWSPPTPVLAPCSLTPVLYCLATGKHKSCPWDVSRAWSSPKPGPLSY